MTDFGSRIKNKQKSEDWFKEAAKYVNTYYGQLAFVEIFPDKKFEIEILSISTNILISN